MTPITHRNREIERLERELAAKDAQVSKLTAQLRAVKDMNKTYQEQHAQSRENAQLLYTTLRKAAPDVLKSIEGALWQNTTEYDKLMSEGRRWQEKCQRSERELAASREDVRRLREAIEVALYKYAPSSKPSLSTSLNSNDYARQCGAWQVVTMIHEVLASVPKAGDK